MTPVWSVRGRFPTVSKACCVSPFAPMPNPVSAPLRAPPLPGRVESNETPHAKISRINTMLGSHMPGPADFDARITRYAPLLMFVIAMALGFASVCMRRIEIASALHAGYPKTAMLLQLFLETLATVAASCVACLPVVAIVPLILTGSGDAMPVVAMLCRVPGAMSVGMLAGTAVGGMTIRERQLFAYFKARA